jgi:L-asparagine oxygenase
VSDQLDGIAGHVLDRTERGAFHAEGARLVDRLDDAGDAPDIDSGRVSPGLRAFLTRFATDTPGPGVALVRGIALGDLPATPDVRTTGYLAGHATTGNLLLVAELLGSPIGYADEKDGALVHEVHPVRGEEQRIENSGSTTFGFHTENVHHPLRPDFLGLLCLRQDHDRVGTTRVSSMREAAGDLSSHTLRVLRSTRFRSHYPTSFATGAGNRRPASDPHPVLFGTAPQHFLRFNVHNTYAFDDEGSAALAELAAALDRHCRQILLEPGDLILIDNHVAVHGRSAFTPRYDGHDRWLRRCYSRREVPGWARRAMRRPGVVPAMAEIQLARPGTEAGQPLAELSIKGR